MLISPNKCMLTQWSATLADHHLGPGIDYFNFDSKAFSKTHLSMRATADLHAVSPSVACKQALDVFAQITVMELSCEQMA